MVILFIGESYDGSSPKSVARFPLPQALGGHAPRPAECDSGGD